jgi:hypothetical protein
VHFLVRRVSMRWLVFALLFWAVSGVADAAEMTTKVGNRLLQVVKTADGSEEVLMIDGARVHSSYLVIVDNTLKLGDLTVIIGTSGAGGNACEGAPFVVTFKRNSPPRLDGPIDSCRPVQFRKLGHQLEFWTDALPGLDGQRWSWSATNGFSQPRKSAFRPDRKKGWDAFAKKTAGHPSDVFQYKVIHDQMQSLLGEDFAAYQEQARDLGSGEFAGSVFEGSACTKLTCDSTGAFLIVDTAKKQVFVALKKVNADLIVHPQRNEWPEPYVSRLDDWAQKFGK